MRVGEVPVHRGTGHTQHLRDVGGRHVLLPQAARFVGIGVVDLAPVGGGYRLTDKV
jgi:hypothetical protein